MSERLAKAEPLFHEALELPPEQRETFLRQACGEDMELLREVTALLRASGIADQWLKDTDYAAVESLIGSSLPENLSEGPGSVVGRYKLLEKIGEGGFGAVYMAEQQEPVRRKVALKIIKLGMDTKIVIARFEAERQALALMDHPNIAKVLDAGATETGRPYFVMELVRGVPMTRFCDENLLGITERLELFIQVCAAIQHAHQKGIIHRDIKPTNVLVTLNDGVPHPIICEEEPPRPSTRLTRIAGPNRNASLASRPSPLATDLDWIVMKCLEKDRTRRYETANGLAADLKRHLENEPVVARPPTAAYRFQKLARRNKLAFLAAGAVLVALVAGLAVALIAFAQERAANRVAEQQRRLANERLVAALQRVETFLADDLPKVSQLAGSTAVMRDILRKTLAYMSALAPTAGDSPEFLLVSAKVHARLALLQGSPFRVSLGDPEAALPLASNAWVLLHSIPAGALPGVRMREATYRVEEAMGGTLAALGRGDEATEHYERMIALGTELDQELPRTNDWRWSSQARGEFCDLLTLLHRFDRQHEELPYLLGDPYLLTTTNSDDLRRLECTARAWWRQGVYSRAGTGEMDLALDFYCKALSFAEAYLKRSSANQSMWQLDANIRLESGLILCLQHKYSDGLPMTEDALRRMEELADRDKDNWVFQDFMLSHLRTNARRHATADREGEFSPAKRLGLFKQAQDYYQRCLDKKAAMETNRFQVASWFDGTKESITREMKEVETEITALQASPK
jgi:tetratricopeptide (TPR) repeat protein